MNNNGRTGIIGKNRTTTSTTTTTTGAGTTTSTSSTSTTSTSSTSTTSTSSTTTTSTTTTSTTTTSTTTTTTLSVGRANLLFESRFEGVSYAGATIPVEIGGSWGNQQHCCAHNVVAAPTSKAGSGAAQIEIRRTDTLVTNPSAVRSELIGPVFNTNARRMYGFSLYVPNDDVNDGTEQIVWQIHQQAATGNIPYYISIAADNTWTLSYNKSGVIGTANYTNRSLQGITRGAWTDFVLEVVQSQSGAGYIVVYINGINVFDTRSIAGPYNIGYADGGYMKMGIYKPAWGTDPIPHGNMSVTFRKIYMDEVRIGNNLATYNDVAPTQALVRQNLIFTEKFDNTPPYSQWSTSQLCCPYSGTSVTSPTRIPGGKSIRFEQKFSDWADHAYVRSELQHTLEEGAVDRWYGFSYYFPSSGFAADTLQIITQWHHTSGSGSPPLSLNTENNNYVVVWSDNPDVENYNTIAGVTIQRDQWVDMVWHVRWAPNATGLTQIYINGTLRYNRSGANMFAGFNNYLKIGNYKFDWKLGPTATSTRVFYMDEVRIGNQNATYFDVAPGDY